MRAACSTLLKTKAKDLSTFMLLKYFEIRITKLEHYKAAVQILGVCDLNVRDE